MWTYRHSETSLIRHSAALSLFVSVGISLAQEQAVTEPAAAAAPKVNRLSPGQVKDKQLDVSLETRDIERVLGKIKKASDLAKQRITEAAEITESVTASLNKGESGLARADARQASEKFKEIVNQLEALLKEEAPQQIAEAQQLANQLARLEREFAQRFEGALNPLQVMGSGETKVDPKSQVRPMVDKETKPKGKGSSQSEQGDSNRQTGDPSPSAENKEDQDSSNKGGSNPKSGDQQGSAKADQEKPDRGQSEDPAPEGKGVGEEKRKDGADNDTKDADDGGSSGLPDEKKKGGNGTEDSDDRSAEKPKSNGKSQKPQANPQGDADPGGTAEQLRTELGKQADKLAETGKTLEDILNSIAKSENPADKEAAARIQEILKEFNLNKIVEQMEGAKGLIRSKKDVEVKLSSLDLAERFEILAQRLDTAYRNIVVPQAEELRKLEQALVDLREKLEELETPSHVNSWHREVRELLERADQLGVSQEVRAQFEEELRKGGFAMDRDPTRRDVNWSLVNDRYVAPGGYLVALTNIQEEIQNRIQTLLLGDMGRLSDDAAPPSYQSLVDRYYQLLSGETEKVSKPLPATQNVHQKRK